MAGAGLRTLARGEENATVAGSSRQWIEIRRYHFDSLEKQKAYGQFLSGAAIAAFGRAGAKPVGVFREMAGDNPKLKLSQDSTDLWVILGHESAQACAEFESRLAGDAEYQGAGKPILSAGKEDAAFSRYDTELLIAFGGFPRVMPRALSESRVLELRNYESPNQERAANKVAMFNRGEIPIFDRCGLPGIFWGSAIAGGALPHLTYMVWHETIEHAPKGWKAFGADPEWIRLKNDPQYKDNVSKVTNIFLRPLPGSQI